MLSNKEASKAHALWKRVKVAVAKEIPVIDKFNMYGFVNGEDTKIFQTLSTQTVGEWVKMTDFTMFGLKYPFENANKKNIDKFIAMIKDTENYQYYLNEYLVDKKHYEELKKYAEDRGLEIKNHSGRYKKNIYVKGIDVGTTIKSTTLEDDKFAIQKFYIKTEMKQGA